MKNSVQDCLPYILIPNGPCELFIAYPKWLCVCLKINMCLICYMMSSLLESSSFFHMSCDLWLSLSPCYLMWLMCDQVMLSLNSSSKNRIKKNKLKIK